MKFKDILLCAISDEMAHIRAGDTVGWRRFKAAVTRVITSEHKCAGE
jgi:hypothetical protein